MTSSFPKPITFSSQLHRNLAGWQQATLPKPLFGTPLLILLNPWSFGYKDSDLKVRQSRNDFFKPTIPPKNKWIKNGLYYYHDSGRLFFVFVFWRKLKTPKRHFEIIWPYSNLCFSDSQDIIFYFSVALTSYVWLLPAFAEL